ncbi:AI-2E family transporter [Streptomyces griseoaurantiacus]|nr:AI-2E family transporter [Streptomyces griseoaurantiacus]
MAAWSAEGVQVLPDPVRRLAAWCVVALLVAGVGWVVVELGRVFRPAVVPVLLALLGSALLAPLHRRLVGVGVHRSLSAFVTCVAVVAVVGGALFIVVSALVDNGAQIVDSVRRAAQSLTDRLGSSGTSVDSLSEEARKLAGRFGGSAVSGVVTGVGYISETVATAVLALLLVFFFLRDGDRAVGGLRGLSPYGSADTVEAVARRAFRAVEGFMRGTTFIALIDAALITAGLLGLRVPGAVGLGALVFVGAYIPYLGAFLSGAVAVLVAFADRGFAVAVWALGLIVAVQLIEGHVLQPVIQSRTVRMHPAVVLVALAAGASVAGILGLLLAVPLAAAVSGAVHEVRDRTR